MSSNLETALIVLAVILAFGIGVLVYVLLGLKKEISGMSSSLQKTSDSADRALREVETTLKSVRSITDNVGDIATDARRLTYKFTDTVGSIKDVSGVLHDATSHTRLSVIGLRAGIKAAAEVLIRKFKSNDQEARNE